MNSDDYDPIAAALKEDIGKGDITTEFFVPEALHASGRIVARMNQRSLQELRRPRRFSGRSILRRMFRSFSRMAKP